MKARRRARRIALQALYEIDCTGHPADQVLAERFVVEHQKAEHRRRPLSDEVRPFTDGLVNGTLAYQARIDVIIQHYASEWPLEQMSIIDRNILRLAIYEFGVDRIIPLRVVINEAVELAKVFGSDSAPRFINGVLGALTPRQAEIRAALEAEPEEAK